MNRKNSGLMRRPKIINIGIIAEDLSDVDVIEVLIGKMTRKSYRIKRFVGEGCGRIIAKCRPWAEQLKKQGCSSLLVVYDSDGKDVVELRRKLEAALAPNPIRKQCVIIPVEELEAWLLADENAIIKAMKLRKAIKMVRNPEGIRDPKEKLRDLVYRSSNHEREYINTVHNKKIAVECAVQKLERCASFVEFKNFILGTVGV